MPTRKFLESLEAMPGDRQRKMEKWFQKSLEAMPLDQLRKAREMTQLQLAEILGVMGGWLETRAVFKDREVRITQVEELAS